MLQAADAWFTYENGRDALKGVSLTVARGDFLVILGENAAGKSTLLKAAKQFPWLWVYVVGGVLVALVVLIMQRKREYPVW